MQGGRRWRWALEACMRAWDECVASGRTERLQVHKQQQLEAFVQALSCHIQSQDKVLQATLRAKQLHQQRYERLDTNLSNKLKQMASRLEVREQQLALCRCENLLMKQRCAQHKLLLEAAEDKICALVTSFAHSTCQHCEVSSCQDCAIGKEQRRGDTLERPCGLVEETQGRGETLERPCGLVLSDLVTQQGLERPCDLVSSSPCDLVISSSSKRQKHAAQDPSQASSPSPSGLQDQMPSLSDLQDRLSWHDVGPIVHKVQSPSTPATPQPHLRYHRRQSTQDTMPSSREKASCSLGVEWSASPIASVSYDFAQQLPESETCANLPPEDAGFSQLRLMHRKAVERLKEVTGACRKSLQESMEVRNMCMQNASNLHVPLSSSDMVRTPNRQSDVSEEATDIEQHRERGRNASPHEYLQPHEANTRKTVTVQNDSIQWACDDDLVRALDEMKREKAQERDQGDGRERDHDAKIGRESSRGMCGNREGNRERVGTWGGKVENGVCELSMEESIKMSMASPSLGSSRRRDAIQKAVVLGCGLWASLLVLSLARSLEHLHNMPSHNGKSILVLFVPYD